MKSKEEKLIQLKTEELRLSKVSRHEFKNIKRSEIYVIIDRINNGYNIGSILRLCDNVLVKKLFIIEGINKMARRALKAAKGTERWVPYEIVESPSEIVKKLKLENVKVAAVEICHDSVDYQNVNYAEKPICFIFGNEVSGVSEELLSLSDIRIHLPVLGMCNSLNVSSCAAIVLFEALKKKTE